MLQLFISFPKFAEFTEILFYLDKTQLVLFVEPLIPCFGLLVTSPLGFKARVGSLIRLKT